MSDVAVIVSAFIGIVGIVLFFVKTPMKRDIKTKEQKQNEIVYDFLQRMEKELTPIKDNQEELGKKKTELLKTFAKELEFNIFFDKDEVREIIKNLASKEIGEN